MFTTVYGSGFDKDDQNKPLSVLEAKRVHTGKITAIRNHSKCVGDVYNVNRRY